MTRTRMDIALEQARSATELQTIIRELRLLLPLLRHIRHLFP